MLNIEVKNLLKGVGSVTDAGIDGPFCFYCFYNVSIKASVPTYFGMDDLISAYFLSSGFGLQDAYFCGRVSSV